MKFNKKILSETTKTKRAGKKTFTEGKKQNIIISDGQLERLLEEVNKPIMIESVISEAFKLIRESIVRENLDLNIEDYSETIISESQDEWRGHNPGASAASGIENIIDGVKKAYDMIKDSDTRRKLANSITKLGNFMSYTAELIGSGSSQRAPRSYEDIADDLPYPEFDESSEELDEQEQDDKLIQEDIKKMKQIIKPIARV